MEFAANLQHFRLASFAWTTTLPQKKKFPQRLFHSNRTTFTFHPLYCQFSEATPFVNSALSRETSIYLALTSVATMPKGQKIVDWTKPENDQKLLLAIIKVCDFTGAKNADVAAAFGKPLSRTQRLVVNSVHRWRCPCKLHRPSYLQAACLGQRREGCSPCWDQS